MKPTSRYEAARYQLPPNSVFSLHETEYNYEVTGPPAIDSSRAEYGPNGYTYRLTPDELYFYQDAYVRISSESSSKLDLPLRQEYADAVKDRIHYGKNEVAIFNFLQERARNAVVLGDIGWGKSTLLRYVFHYALPLSERLASRYFPVYISFDQYTVDLLGLNTEDEVRKAVRETIIFPKLARIGREFWHLDNEDFWTFIKSQDGYAPLARREKAVRLLYGPDTDKIRAACYEAREEAAQRSDFHPLTLNQDFHFGPGTATVYTRSVPNSTSFHAEPCTSPLLVVARAGSTAHSR